MQIINQSYNSHIDSFEKDIVAEPFYFEICMYAHTKLQFLVCILSGFCVNNNNNLSSKCMYGDVSYAYICFSLNTSI